MALVQVIGVQIEAERAQNAQAADPQNDLLLQPTDLVAAVEKMGQRAGKETGQAMSLRFRRRPRPTKLPFASRFSLNS